MTIYALVFYILNTWNRELLESVILMHNDIYGNLYEVGCASELVITVGICEILNLPKRGYSVDAFTSAIIGM